MMSQTDGVVYNTTYVPLTMQAWRLFPGTFTAVHTLTYDLNDDGQVGQQSTYDLKDPGGVWEPVSVQTNL